MRKMRKQLTLCTLAGVLAACCPVGGAHAEDAVASPQLRFDPPSPVVLGDPVAWSANGLEAEAEYSVIADLRDEWGRAWQASAVFVADASGSIDPAQQAPLRGDYEAVDPLGMFWSGSRLVEPEIQIKGPAVASPVTISIHRDDRLVASRTLMRWVLGPGVQEKDLTGEGLVGRLYVPDGGESGAAVVLLGGSGGGMQWQRLMAAVLASKGYTALALAYFNAPRLPERLEQIPVEYVRRALDALGRERSVDPARVAIVGYSKGSELALLAASRFGDVKAVAGYAPSSVAFQAFLPPDFPSISSWSLGGEDVPFVPLRGYRRSASSVENWMTYLSQEEAVREASIQVEHAQGAVLLLTGRDDAIWPSSLMAEQIVNRMQEKDFVFPIVHLAFPEAGHGIARPGYLPTGPTAKRNGGTAAGTAKAQAGGWQALLEFLRDSL